MRFYASRPTISPGLDSTRDRIKSNQYHDGSDVISHFLCRWTQQTVGQPGETAPCLPLNRRHCEPQLEPNLGLIDLLNAGDVAAGRRRIA